ncbi:MAG TPA: hypothetical protein PK544_19220 [Spirochaetota bacterium]|nr:hypothetical protein [Spirochaetota bacterium]
MINLKPVESIAAVFLMTFMVVFLQCSGETHHNAPDHKDEPEHAEQHETAKGHDAEQEKEEHTEHHGEDEHEAGSRSEPGNFGKDMAVTAADREKGIQLSPKALRTTGIATTPLSTYRTEGGIFRVPKSAVIHYEEKTAVYILRDGWFLLSPVSGVHEAGNVTIIKIPGAKTTDSIVIKKTAILRLAHLEAFGASGHGHGH